MAACDGNREKCGEWTLSKTKTGLKVIEQGNKGWQILTVLQPGLKDLMRLVLFAAEIGVTVETRWCHSFWPKKQSPLLFFFLSSFTPIFSSSSPMNSWSRSACDRHNNMAEMSMSARSKRSWEDQGDASLMEPAGGKGNAHVDLREGSKCEFARFLSGVSP